MFLSITDAIQNPMNKMTGTVLPDVQNNENFGEKLNALHASVAQSNLNLKLV